MLNLYILKYKEKQESSIQRIHSGTNYAVNCSGKKRQEIQWNYSDILLS